MLHEKLFSKNLKCLCVTSYQHHFLYLYIRLYLKPMLMNHTQKTKCAAMQSYLKVVFSGLILYESLALGKFEWVDNGLQSYLKFI